MNIIILILLLTSKIEIYFMIFLIKLILYNNKYLIIEM